MKIIEWFTNRNIPIEINNLYHPETNKIYEVEILSLGASFYSNNVTDALNDARKYYKDNFKFIKEII